MYKIETCKTAREVGEVKLDICLPLLGFDDSEVVFVRGFHACGVPMPWSYSWARAICDEIKLEGKGGKVLYVMSLCSSFSPYI